MSGAVLARVREYALDFDELERHDDEALSCTGRAAGCNCDLLRHFLLAGQGEELLAPEVIGGTMGAGYSHTAYTAANGMGTYNLVARFGASISSGGTRPR